MEEFKDKLMILLEKNNKQVSTEEGIALLDKAINGDNKLIDDFIKLIKPNGPMIYAFITPKVKDAIKIGYTDQTPKKRIEQWEKIYNDDKHKITTLGYWSAEEVDNIGQKVFFWDHAVHGRVEQRGYKNIKKEEFYNFIADTVDEPAEVHVSKEFFRKYKDISANDATELSKDIIEDILNEMKADIRAGKADFTIYSMDRKNTIADTDLGALQTYSNTDLQKEAIDNAVNAIKAGKKNLLMAAVMRFGKTHAAYEIVKESGLRKILVTSAKADVRKAWRDDINHIDFQNIDNNFVFIEFGKDGYDITFKEDKNVKTRHKYNIDDDINKIDELYNAGKTVIMFATLQDLAGSLKTLKSKHLDIMRTKFDMMIVDETHYGSHANTWGKVDKLNKNMLNDEEEFDDINDDINQQKKDKALLKSIDVKYDISLQVSGTPYYILASNEMLDKDAEVISKVSYTDMMTARDKWEEEHPEENAHEPWKSPYFGVPTLHKIGLKLTKECRQIINKNSMSASLNALFVTKGNKFVYEKEIRDLMKGIFGDDNTDSLGFLNNKSVEGNKVCRHTMIVMPRIKSCVIMKDILKDIIDTNNRKVICIVGPHPDIDSIATLNDTLLKLDDENKKSVILTVNKYLTGVSMPCLDSMIYLKNAKSPQDYDQAIFRLCTRKVEKVKSKDGDEKQVNLKRNVYLIDFNIDNMFNMVANSARMKACADGDASVKNIKKYIEQDINTIPIYSEQVNGELLGKMKQMTLKDMMLTYTKYNANKSIEDIINDEISQFDILFNNNKFLSAVSKLNIDGDNGKKSIEDPNGEGEDNLNIKGSGNSSSDSFKGMSVSDKISQSKEIKEAKKKFRQMVKNILYCNLCLDNPYGDMGEFLKNIDNNEQLHEMIHDFKLSAKMLKDIYNNMSTSYKIQFNDMMTQLSMLNEDTNKSDFDKIATGIASLGKIGKSIVVTPPALVNKMIDKLTKEDYEKAETILTVNSKYGEFLIGLYKKYGKDIANKVRMVPASVMTKYFCKKIVKSLGLNDYIILDIQDENKDGILYDNFLEMNNEKLLKEYNMGKKYDITLMNPPYDQGLGDKFFEKSLQISNKVCTVQPLNWLIGAKQKTKITNVIDKCYCDIETINGNKYFDAGFGGNVSINYIDINKTHKLIYNNKEFDKCADIHMYSNDNYLVEFADKTQHFSVSLWDKIKHTETWGRGYEDNPNNAWWCIKTPQIRGHVNKNGGKESKDFYTVISNDNEFLKNNIGQYKNIKTIKNRQGNFEFGYFAFNTKQELDNFINYIKTDFVRVCLMLSKTNMNMHRGCLKTVPWFDFSDEHFSKSPREIDDWLFKKYDISDDIRKHIEEILPDYYNIRK